MLRKKLANMELAKSIVDKVSVGRRRSLDDLPDDLAAEVKTELEVAAPVVADTPPLLLPAVEPQAADAPLVDIDDWEPMHGSYLLEMVAAVMDDGSGREVVPTAEDVERVLKENGLSYNT